MLDQNDFQIYENFFTDSSISFDSLNSELNWDNTLMIGNKYDTSRRGGFQGEFQENGTRVYFRCPSNSFIQRFTPCVQKMINIINNTFIKNELGINIVKYQKYHDGQSHIVKHSDKTLDLCPESKIYVARFGSSRDFVLTHKTTGEKKHFLIHDNTLIVMGLKTNADWYHSIVKTNDNNNVSISLILRRTETFIRADNRIFGIGARFKTEHDLNQELNKQHQELVLAYANENKNTFETFNREKIYGNVINNTF